MNITYRKAALNMLTIMYSKDLPKINPAFKINSGCPGFTDTSFNKHSTFHSFTPLTMPWLHFHISNAQIQPFLQPASVHQTKLPRSLPGSPHFPKTDPAGGSTLTILRTRISWESSRSRDGNFCRGNIHGVPWCR